MATLLSDAEIAQALAELSSWSLSGKTITRTFDCASFPEAVDFVGRVAVEAELANHHPDIDIRWRKVTFTLSTHSAGGLTELDVQLARTIDRLA